MSFNDNNMDLVDDSTQVSQEVSSNILHFDPFTGRTEYSSHPTCTSSSSSGPGSLLVRGLGRDRNVGSDGQFPPGLDPILNADVPCVAPVGQVTNGLSTTSSASHLDERAAGSTMAAATAHPAVSSRNVSGQGCQSRVSLNNIPLGGSVPTLGNSRTGEASSCISVIDCEEIKTLFDNGVIDFLAQIKRETDEVRLMDISITKYVAHVKAKTLPPDLRVKVGFANPYPSGMGDLTLHMAHEANLWTETANKIVAKRLANMHEHSRHVQTQSFQNRSPLAFLAAIKAKFPPGITCSNSLSKHYSDLYIAKKAFLLQSMVDKYKAEDALKEAAAAAKLKKTPLVTEAVTEAEFSSALDDRISNSVRKFCSTELKNIISTTIQQELKALGNANASKPAQNQPADPYPKSNGTQNPKPNGDRTQVPKPNGNRTHVPKPNGNRNQNPNSKVNRTQNPNPKGNPKENGKQNPKPNGDRKLDPNPKGNPKENGKQNPKPNGDGRLHPNLNRNLNSKQDKSNPHINKGKTQTLNHGQKDSNSNPRTGTSSANPKPSYKDVVTTKPKDVSTKQNSAPNLSKPKDTMSEGDNTAITIAVKNGLKGSAKKKNQPDKDGFILVGPVCENHSGVSKSNNRSDQTENLTNTSSMDVVCHGSQETAHSIETVDENVTALVVAPKNASATRTHGLGDEQARKKPKLDPGPEKDGKLIHY